jgi:hypothetical protein
MKINYQKYADTACISATTSPEGALIILVWVENWRNNLELTGIMVCYAK